MIIWSSLGRQFHSAGPEKEKERGPSFVHSLDDLWMWMVFRQWMRLVLGRAAWQLCVPLHHRVLLWCHTYNCRQQQQLLTCRGWRLRTTAVLSRHITSALTSGRQQSSTVMR